jgi:hypothetical protein
VQENRILVVTSADKFGAELKARLEGSESIFFAFDKSPLFVRAVKLLAARAVSFRFLLRAVVCGALTNRKTVSGQFVDNWEGVMRLATGLGVQKIIMFRMGLFLPKQITGKFEVLNVHSARLPDYQGLGSILRALDAGDLHQQVTIHRATSKIDSGEILMTLKYTMDKSKSYCDNENVAYSAGVDAVAKYVSQIENSSFLGKSKP